MRFLLIFLDIFVSSIHLCLALNTELSIVAPQGITTSLDRSASPFFDLEKMERHIAARTPSQLGESTEHRSSAQQTSNEERVTTKETNCSKGLLKSLANAFKNMRPRRKRQQRPSRQSAQSGRLGSLGTTASGVQYSIDHIEGGGDSDGGKTGAGAPTTSSKEEGFRSQLQYFLQKELTRMHPPSSSQGQQPKQAISQPKQADPGAQERHRPRHLILHNPISVKDLATKNYALPSSSKIPLDDRTALVLRWAIQKQTQRYLRRAPWMPQGP